MSNLLSTVRKLDTGEEALAAEPSPSNQDGTMPRPITSGKISFFPSYIPKPAKLSEESVCKEEPSPKSSVGRSQLHFTSPQLPPRPSLLLRPLGARPPTALLSKLESMQNYRAMRLGDPQVTEEKITKEEAHPSSIPGVLEDEIQGPGDIDRPMEFDVSFGEVEQQIESADGRGGPVCETGLEQPMEIECSTGILVEGNDIQMATGEQKEQPPSEASPLDVDIQNQKELDNCHLEEEMNETAKDLGEEKREMERRQFEDEKRNVEELRKQVDLDLQRLEEDRKELESRKQLELERQRLEEEKKALQHEVEARSSELDAARNRLEEEKKEHDLLKETALEMESSRRRLEEEGREIENRKAQIDLERQQLENEKQGLEEEKKALESIKQILHEEKEQWEARTSIEKLALQEAEEQYKRLGEELTQQADAERKRLLLEEESTKQARLQFEEEAQRLRETEARVAAERKQMETEQRQWQALADGWQRRQKELEVHLAEEKDKSQALEKAIEAERKLYLEKYKALEECRREEAKKWDLAQKEKEELTSQISAKEDKLKEGQNKLKAKKEKYNQKKHKLEQEKLMLLDDRVWFTDLRKKLEQELAKLEEERRKIGEEREKQERILLKLDEERTYIERMYREEQSRLEAAQKKRLEKKEKKKQMKLEEEQKREEARRLEEEKEKEERLKEEQRKKEEEARRELEASLNIPNQAEARQENEDLSAEKRQDDPLVSNSEESRTKKSGVSFSLPEQDASSAGSDGMPQSDGIVPLTLAGSRPKCTDETQTRPPFSYPLPEKRDPNSFHFLSAQEWATRMEGKSKCNNNGLVSQWQRVATKAPHIQEPVLANGLPAHLIFEYALAGIPMMFEVDPKSLAERLQVEGKAQTNKLPPLRARPVKKRPASVLHPNAASLPQASMAQQLTQKRAKVDTNYWDSLLLS